VEMHVNEASIKVESRREELITNARQEWADRRRKVEEDKINEGYLAEHTKLLEESKATECAEAMRLKILSKRHMSEESKA
jgi:hypothetical protein